MRGCRARNCYPILFLLALGVAVSYYLTKWRLPIARNLPDLPSPLESFKNRISGWQDDELPSQLVFKPPVNKEKLKEPPKILPPVSVADKHNFKEPKVEKVQKVQNNVPVKTQQVPDAVDDTESEKKSQSQKQSHEDNTIKKLEGKSLAKAKFFHPDHEPVVSDERTGLKTNIRPEKDEKPSKDIHPNSNQNVEKNKIKNLSVQIAHRGPHGEDQKPQPDDADNIEESEKKEAPKDKSNHHSDQERHVNGKIHTQNEDPHDNDRAHKPSGEHLKNKYFQQLLHKQRENHKKLQNHVKTQKLKSKFLKEMMNSTKVTKERLGQQRQPKNLLKVADNENEPSDEVPQNISPVVKNKVSSEHEGVPHAQRNRTKKSSRPKETSKHEGKNKSLNSIPIVEIEKENQTGNKRTEKIVELRRNVTSKNPMTSFFQAAKSKSHSLLVDIPYLKNFSWTKQRVAKEVPNTKLSKTPKSIQLEEQNQEQPPQFKKVEKIVPIEDVNTLDTNEIRQPHSVKLPIYSKTFPKVGSKLKNQVKRVISSSETQSEGILKTNTTKGAAEAEMSNNQEESKKVVPVQVKHVNSDEKPHSEIQHPADSAFEKKKHSEEEIHPQEQHSKHKKFPKKHDNSESNQSVPKIHNKSSQILDSS